jgi:streptogramin lyase
VTDCTRDDIQFFRPDLSFLGKASGPGSTPGRLNCPFDIATEGNDYVYVADLSNTRVTRFTGLDSDVPLDYVQDYVLRGTDKQPCAPYGVAVDASHNIWIAGGPTRDECQVVGKFDRRGTQLLTFGSRGTGDGQFYGYMDVFPDAAGNVYVSDFANGRVQKFDTNGSFLAKFGREGTGDGNFYGPHGLTVDPAGNIWVAETGINYRIQAFTSGQLFAAKFGGQGTGPGQFTTAYDVAADSNCNVYAVDTSGIFDGAERIQVFGQSEAPFCRAATPAPPAAGTTVPGGAGDPAPPVPPDKASPGVVVTGTAAAFNARRGFTLPLRVNEDCTVLASAKVNITDGTSRVYSVSARRASARKGRTLKLRLKGVKKTNTAIANALKRGRKLKAKVTITALDKAGNATTKRATLKLSR